MCSRVYTKSDLIKALEAGSVEEVEKIMESGNVTDFHKYDSPLTLYLKYRRSHDERGLSIVKILVQYESVEYCNREGETALTYAAQRSHIDIFQFLLERGYNICYGRYGGCSSIQSILRMHRSWHANLERKIPMLEIALPYISEDKMAYYYEYAKDQGASQEVLDLLMTAHKKIILSDIWLLNSEEYDSLFQWHPREIMEDVLALF